MDMSCKRRTLVRIVAAGAGSLLLGRSVAQPTAFPSKPIRLVVPAPAGGGADSLGRMIADRIAPSLGQPVVVDNKPGANTLIATQEVMKSPPDGYTVLLTFTVLVQNPLLYGKKAGYDPLKNLVPVARVADALAFFAVNSDVGATDVAAFLAAARAAPGKFSYGTMGIGSTPHLYTEILARQAGVNLVHVPYRGEAPMLPDLVGGRVHAGWLSIQTAQQMASSGRVRLLALSGGTRMASLPQVPTFKELGFSNMDADGWAGIFAPEGTPKPIVDRLSTEIERAMASPELRQKATMQGIEPRFAGAAEFAQMVRRSQGDWARIIELTGIRLEM